MAEAVTNEIEFVKGDPDGGSSNENVKTDGPSDVKAGSGSVGTGIKGEKFQKVVMKPKTGGCSGQCKVYNSKLFTDGKGGKVDEDANIPEGVLTSAGIDSSGGKYSSITVYYIYKGEGVGGRATGARKYMALLVEFVPGNGIGGVTKTYIKRTGRGGDKWASTTATGIGIGVGTGDDGDRSLLSLLKEEWEKLRPLIEFENGHGVGGRGNENITTSEPEEIKRQEDSSSQNYTFKKVTMTANIDGGQWKVFNRKLFTGYESSTSIDDGVLDRAGITTSGSNKYRSITVYYSLTGTRYYNPLLVEFEKASTASGTSSDKIYIKRTNQGGTKWERTDAKGMGIRTGGNVTAEVLDKIRMGAGVGNSSEIQINTDKGQGTHDYPSFKIQVAEEKPWDKLSKVFKRYTHTITYTGGGDYISTNHNIKVYDKSSYIKFQYKTPKEKVEKVEIYFSSSDKNKMTPLILGFINNNSQKYYYTYNHLKRTRNWYSSIGSEGKITDNDLLTRLLEEIGSSVKRPQKYVINLNQKPSGTTSYMYPVSGPNQQMVTINKEKPEFGFEKYVHTINGSHSVEQFYVSFDKNSRYFENAGRSDFWLDKVTVYFKSGSEKPVLFELSFRSKGTYIYTYFDFVTDLKKLTTPGEAKKINQLTQKTSDLQSTLQKESEKLREAITFVNQDGEQNENISEELANVDLENKFTKVTMKVNTDDAKGGSSVGPWKVHNNTLFTLERGMKIKGGFLGDITTGDVNRSDSKKYKTITVYYAMTDDSDCDIDIDCDCNFEYNALLVEFDEGSSKKYFKRANKDGSLWTPETDVNTDDGELTRKLAEIEKVVKGHDAAKKDTSSTTSSNDAAIASSTVTTLLVSGGTGFAIYKYPQVFLTLIRKIIGSIITK